MKAICDIHSPVSGNIVEVYEVLHSSPGLVIEFRMRGWFREVVHIMALLYSRMYDRSNDGGACCNHLGARDQLRVEKEISQNLGMLYLDRKQPGPNHENLGMLYLDREQPGPNHELRSRRRPRYSTHILTLTATLLLLLSVTILYIHLTNHHQPPIKTTDPINPLDKNPLPIFQNNNHDDVITSQDDVTITSPDDVKKKYYFDHVQGVIRRAFDKRSIDQWEEEEEDYEYSIFDSSNNNVDFNLGFGSDDVALDENVRRKLVKVKGIEDALLLKVSVLREGWGDWFEKKSDFLRRDRMFKSNFELLNPLNHPFLQDPDMVGNGFSGFTKGDKLMLKHIVSDFKKVPFTTKKEALGDPVPKVAERRTLDDNVGIRQVPDKIEGQIYADGKRKGKCVMRVFMVWNSPPWMFSVRHQRGLESLFFHHRDACVVVFSETIELNFFDGFVKDGFKVAVAMPNLDELLKDTPTHEFASVWFEWRKTKFYPTHYSELIRLAALYKYGGIYLDSDVKVMKPLDPLSNMVGLEDESSDRNLNGAVMAFRKHSPFIMECLMEFYASYDDTSLRWNGADLLTRVGKKFLHEENGVKNQMELKLQPFFAFFPISRKNITRYFTRPATDTERADQGVLYQKILDESLAFHFWNSLTSSIVPEPESLVARLIDQHWTTLEVKLDDDENSGSELEERLQMVHRRHNGSAYYTSDVWSNLLRIRGPLVRELILEFFSTIYFEDTHTELDRPTTLQFQLGGILRRMSMRDFICILGLHTLEDTRKNYFLAYYRAWLTKCPEKGELETYWRSISSGGTILMRSIAPSYTLIREPMRKMIHQLLSHSITGRGDGRQKVSAEDVFYLRSMDDGPIVNVPYCLARYMAKGASVCTVEVEPMGEIGPEYLIKLNICGRNPAGEIMWSLDGPRRPDDVGDGADDEQQAAAAEEAGPRVPAGLTSFFRLQDEYDVAPPKHSVLSFFVFLRRLKSTTLVSSTTNSCSINFSAGPAFVEKKSTGDGVSATKNTDMPCEITPFKDESCSTKVVVESNDQVD
uniref:Alpha 1,4-glycosyltransferase domain-containing protein n=1 Tax=Tanacetum cinerariifolium TaxID=118510 RepID=A0A6L2MHM0_TANCI|nr:alpha 1,4-glycosyltransferase domain-containing protein [Tanacetum cinerariifolium]